MRLDAVNLKQGRLAVKRSKNSLSTEQPLAGDELRAIKRYLAIREDKLPWLFLSERGQPMTRQAVNYLAERGWGAGEVWAASGRTCCATPAVTLWRTRAPTSASSRTTLATETLDIQHVTRAPAHGGSRGCGIRSQLRADYAGNKGSALSSVAAYAVRNCGHRRDEPSSSGLFGSKKAPCSLASLRVCTTRARHGCRLALLLGISLFDQIKRLPRALAPCLIIGEQMVTAIAHSAHQIHGLLAKLIATQRHVVAVAERLPLRVYGASRECQTYRCYQSGRIG